MTQDHATSTWGESSVERLFGTTVRGFNKKEVEDYIVEMSAKLSSAESHLTSLQAKFDGQARELEQARHDLDKLRSENSANKPQHEELSERLAQILRLAGEEADQERAKAAQEADHALEQARDQSAKVLEAARSAAEGIIAAARERAEKEAAAAKAEAESLLSNATASSQATISDAEQRAAQVLADADRRTSQISHLQDERLSALSDVHTDTLRRLEAVRGVLEKVLIAEADAGPPNNGISTAPLPAAGVAMRAADVDTSAPIPAAQPQATQLQAAPVEETSPLAEAALLDDDEIGGEPPLAADFAEDAESDLAEAELADAEKNGEARVSR